MPIVREEQTVHARWLRASSSGNGPIERVALRGLEAGVADDAAQLFFGGAVGDAGGAHHVLFQHDRAHVVAAEAQAHLADFQTLRHPARLHVHEVVERYSREIARTFRYSTAVASSQSRPPSAVFCGWKLQGMNAVKPPVSSCNSRTLLEVIDAMLECLAHAEHHGGGGAHAQLVRGAMHVDPVFGQALQAGDLVADFVVENFRAAAGNGIEPGIAQAANGVAQVEMPLYSAMAMISDAEKQCSGSSESAA